MSDGPLVSVVMPVLNEEEALGPCIEKINHLVSEKGAAYDFVVVTGDLGIEQLVKGLGEAERREQWRTLTPRWTSSRTTFYG